MTSVAKRVDSIRGRRAASTADHPARTRIVEAAAAAVEEYGEAPGTSRVAALAGVPRPHVYRHFSSKDELLVEVARHAAQELRSHVRAALQSSGTPIEVVRPPVDASVGWADEHPGLYRFLARHRQGREGPGGGGHLLDAVVAVAAAYAGTAGLAAPSAGTMAGLMGMVDASTLWWLEHRDESRADLVDRLTRQVLLVLEAQSGPAAATTAP